MDGIRGPQGLEISSMKFWWSVSGYSEALMAKAWLDLFASPVRKGRHETRRGCNERT